MSKSLPSLSIKTVTATLMPLMKAVEWDQERLDNVAGDLQFYLDFDQQRRDRQRFAALTAPEPVEDPS